MIVDLFAELFEGNESATGTEEGGCDRTPTTHEERIRRHLHEGPPIGIYPMADVVEPLADPKTYWGVKWGMVDFDLGDAESFRQANQLREGLRLLGIKGWVERSKSKGYHVWVFASTWVPAETMRHALLWVSEIVDTSTKEVNPKQVALNAGQLGNYARLPYPGFGAMPDITPPKLERRVVLHPATGLPMSLSGFVNGAWQSRVLPLKLYELAARYKPPVKYQREFDPDASTSEDVAELLELIPKYARKIWNEGPLEGGDRSRAMFKLASLIYEADELSFEDTYTLLQAAPWQKFAGRADEHQRIMAVLDRVWSR